MSSSRNKSGFTLLEIMLAVAVLSVVVLSVYRFVETTLSAVMVSSQQAKENFFMDSFIHYLRTELQNLPQSRTGALTGEPHKFNEVPCDEIRWIATAGSGLLTRHAVGEWNVTLTAQQLPDGSFEMGMRRQDIEGRNDSVWLPLFDKVRGFEIRYFDTRSLSWVDKWTDLAVRPSLVRMRLWRDPNSEPYEVVFQLPAVTPGAQIPVFNGAQQNPIGVPLFNTRGQPNGQVPQPVPGQPVPGQTGGAFRQITPSP